MSTKKNRKKQSGKGLSGFVLGLLLATVVIAGVVFFINRSNERVFKEGVVEEAPAPEILTPDRNTPSVPETPAVSEPSLEASEDVSDVIGDFIREQQASEQTPTQEVITDEVVETPLPVEKPIVSKPRVVEPVKPESKPAEKKAESKPKKEREQPKKVTPKQEVQPSAEQILNSGSIEKAREDVRKEADRKANAGKKTEKSSAQSGRMVVLQMGSFNNRESAESQRAQLAMMGIPSRITEATVNGKRVYRVQSNRLDSNAAKQTQQILKKNGVDSFARTVK